MAVVMEKRIIFGLEDLRALVIRCVNCGGELSAIWRPDKTSTKAFEVDQCPHCHNSWKSSEDTTSLGEDRQHAQALLQAIDYFRKTHYRNRLAKREAKWEIQFTVLEDTD